MQEQQQSMMDVFTSTGGSKTIFKFGVNEGVKIKEWTINHGTDNSALKVVYSKPNPGEEDSTIIQFMNFPKPKMGETAVNPVAVTTFLNQIRSLVGQFANAADIKTAENQGAVLACQELKIDTIAQITQSMGMCHQALATILRSMFQLAETKGLYQLEGSLVLGYNKNGYLTPPNWGEGGVWNSPFYIGGTPVVPAASDKFLHVRPVKQAAPVVEQPADQGW